MWYLGQSSCQKIRHGALDMIHGWVSCGMKSISNTLDSHMIHRKVPQMKHSSYVHATVSNHLKLTNETTSMFLGYILKNFIHLKETMNMTWPPVNDNNRI